MCLVCNGYRFVYVTDNPEDPRFGRASPCPQCQGGETGVRLRRLAAVCRVPDRYRQARLTHFEPDLRRRLERALQDSRGRQLFLTAYGSFGVGKTHLLAALVNAAVEAGLLAVYVTWPEALQHLRDAYAQRVSDSADAFWQNLNECDVLALDEVDKVNATDWAVEQMFGLLNRRYNASKGLTALASNRALRRGEGFFGDAPGPLESRLLGAGNLVIALGGEDRRRGAPAPI